MRSDRGSSVGRNGTQRTDSTVNARVPILIGALPHAIFLPRNNRELAACKTLAKNDFHDAAASRHRRDEVDK